ncbi:MAG: transglycosylase SLT domain-containing protein [Bacteroidales bacterium]|nr:transglycosylase SLT domain-containing protein [Bacteroidales bacterium]
MQKSIPGFLIATLFVFKVSGLASQELQNIGNEVAGYEENEVVKLTLDTVAYIDTLLIDEAGFTDEKPDQIFIDKMDSLANTWYIKHLFHPDSTNRGVYNFPSDLPDSVYILRLQAIQQVIPLSYNKLVKSFIRMYTEKKRSLVEIMLGLSGYYFPVFEEVLDKYEMPLELRYLPVIESALNPKARSRAGANGLWQFMYQTGRQYNLEITSFIDERSDPLKSTEAAVRYLKQLYDVYGDWHLTIAAYNCGPGNVNRAVGRCGNKVNYWDIYYFLPRETREFVPAFIAASYVMNYYKEHNLFPLLPDVPFITDTVMVNDYLHFDQVSEFLNIEKEQLRSLNPMYRRDVIPAKPDKSYPLILPESKIFEFISNDTLIFAHKRDKYFPDNSLANPATLSASDFIPADIKGKAGITYTIKTGDNIGYISSWFNVRAADLRYWNNIHRNLIRAGQKLIVYVPEDKKEKYEKVNTMTFAQKQAMIGKTSETVAGKKPEVEKFDPNYEYYIVKSGDTVWGIAGKYTGISPEDILKLNNLNHRSSLSVGQRLKIRAKQNI